MKTKIKVIAPEEEERAELFVHKEDSGRLKVSAGIWSWSSFAGEFLCVRGEKTYAGFL